MGGPKSTRRAMLRAVAATAAVVCCGDHVATDRRVRASSPDGERAALAAPVPVADGLAVFPRAAWGADLPPRGPMADEEVRFLLVHHTASSNAITDHVGVMRATYAFHTGPAKRWADVAYNFFVAPDGRVFEGRAGSLDRPVVADASGGNQGFSQLVCLIGDHSISAPTPAAQDALVRTLAWLTNRHDLASREGASTTFTSRGSDRFRRGTVVTTPIVSPHRAVTYTACPGDAAIALLPTWRRRVHATAARAWERDGLQRARRTSLGAP